MIRVVILCLIGVLLSTVGFVWSFKMSHDFWGDLFPTHLLANCISLGLSCSAVLLSSYKWKTAEIAVQKEKAIFRFCLVFILASVGGYVFGWFVYLAPIFFGAFVTIFLYCILFFTIRVIGLRGQSDSVNVRLWQTTSFLLALAITIPAICFWLPFIEWLLP